MRGFSFLDRRLGGGNLYIIVRWLICNRSVFSFDGSRTRKSKGERPLVATLPPRHTSPGIENSSGIVEGRKVVHHEQPPSNIGKSYPEKIYYEIDTS